MYCIVKYIKVDKKELPVIILNSQDEVLEFEKEQQAQEMCSILQMNSDSGYRYVIKKIWLYLNLYYICKTKMPS